MPRRVTAACMVSVLFTLAISSTACTATPITLVDEGRSYTQQSASELLDTIEPDPSVLDPGEVDANRTAALARLRREGEMGGKAADLITSAFPSGTRGVPYYVERATVDGAPVWLVAEAIGPKDGSLDDERVWVFSDDGSVLFSATR